MKEMKASMDVIRKTAGEMIDQLTEVHGRFHEWQSLRSDFH